MYSESIRFFVSGWTHVALARCVRSRLSLPLISGAMAEGLCLHLAGVRAFLAQIPDGPAKQKVLGARRKHVEACLLTSSWCVADAAKVAAALPGVFGDSETQALLAVLADRTASVTAVTGRSKLQNYTALPAYFPKEAWQLLLSDRASSQTKLDCIIGHSIRLQLRHPTESSFQVLAALYIAASDGLSNGTAMAGSLKLAVLRQIKRAFKLAGKPLAEEFVLELPSTVEGLRKDFPDLFKRVFEEQPPMACPLDSALLGTLAASVPMRSTSRLVTADPFASCSSSPSSLVSPRVCFATTTATAATTHVGRDAGCVPTNDAGAPAGDSRAHLVEPSPVGRRQHAVA